MSAPFRGWTTDIGRQLFRWRGWIGFAGYGVVLVFSAASLRSSLVSLPLTVAGLALRFWAMGYIGPDARTNVMGVDRLVEDGPYRWVRHPLYVGNAFLVSGTLVALRPPWWLTAPVATLFFVEYTLIANAEERQVVHAGVPAQGGFRLRRAACEWQTLVALAAAYGFGMLKAVLFAARN
jgi:isoprenylcysteine carboxyl methyltransferase (ICMT) family protein YpbQ